MNTLQTQISDYLHFCQIHRRLDSKTLKAYRIDLRQFAGQVTKNDAQTVSPGDLENFIAYLHQNYKPKTVKRKIASLKAFFRYLEYKDLITINPFNKIQIKFREPSVLPKILPLPIVETLLSAIYQQHLTAPTPYQRKNALRDAAVIETLFATGMRISELCSLRLQDVNLYEYTILIHGKGSKERMIQIGNASVIRTLQEYQEAYAQPIHSSGYFFVHQDGNVFSDQSVRRMINKYAALSGIEQHITPHMFRHTFATSLLEADVDIRYIQEMLGHSSIHITEIYTHVATAKQRDILATRHPRNRFKI